MTRTIHTTDGANTGRTRGTTTVAGHVGTALPGWPRDSAIGTGPAAVHVRVVRCSASLQVVDGRAVGCGADQPIGAQAGQDDRERSPPGGLVVGSGSFGDGADHELGQYEVTGSDVGGELSGVPG